MSAAAVIACLPLLVAGPPKKSSPTFRAARTGQGNAVPSAPKPTVVVSDPVAWQAALDRAGFSPGVIDGRFARKTVTALKAFQAFAGLPATGRPDAATRAALGMDSVPAMAAFTIGPSDVARVGPWPRTWHEKADCEFLGYASLADLAAERGHCTVDLLHRLNRKFNLNRLKSGDTLVIPNVRSAVRPARAARIEIDFTDRIIYVLDQSGRVVGLYHCSIAKDKENRPRGPCRVKVIKENPDYLFDPAKWPEVKDVNRKLLIPPGPRCPVGMCWIGLSILGYGIHGTPEPEMIGRTGSHGCFRLTNWDAFRLGKMVRVGTPVRFVEHSTALARAR
jgi:lipoprotein-anchoring transpeptidase ErfK/SrfK